jgi:hypothetical protein
MFLRPLFIVGIRSATKLTYRKIRSYKFITVSIVVGYGNRGDIMKGSCCMAPSRLKGTKMNHNNNLAHRQQFAISEILSSPSLEEARRRIDVSKGTFYGWMKEEAFQAELKRQREVLTEQTFERLKSGMTQAVDKLLELLHAKGQPSIQLRAAQVLLSQSIKAIELQDLECRLDKLEPLVLNNGGRRWH